MNLDIVPSDTKKTMIEEFQCPGCVCGMNINCGSLKLKISAINAFWCEGHVPGTMFGGGIGKILLGLPKGFNRLGGQGNISGIKIRLWLKESHPDWDKFNVAVWAMEKDGYLYVRTYMPRLNQCFIDVIEAGNMDMCPNAINVGQFYGEID